MLHYRATIGSAHAARPAIETKTRETPTINTHTEEVWLLLGCHYSAISLHNKSSWFLWVKYWYHSYFFSYSLIPQLSPTMAHRSQSSSVGENTLDPNYLPPHYREEYRLAIDALIEKGTQVNRFLVCVFHLDYSKGLYVFGFMMQWFWLVYCHTRATMNSFRCQKFQVSWHSRKLSISSPQFRHPTWPPACQNWHIWRQVVMLMAPLTHTGRCSPTWLPLDWIWAGRWHSIASWGPQRSQLWLTPPTKICQVSKTRPGDSSRMPVT